MFNHTVRIIFFIALLLACFYLAVQYTNDLVLAYDSQACKQIEKVHEQPTVYDDGHGCYFIYEKNDGTLSLEPVMTK